MVLKCQTFMITTFRPYILHKLERFILYIPIKWNPNSLPVNLCLSFLFLKGIFIKTKTVYLLISRQSRQVSLEFLVLTVYCFRDWVSVFGFQFLNFNEMIERRARKDSPLYCKKIQDLTILDSGFYTMDSGFQVLDSSLCQWNLDSGFQSGIPWAVLWIPKPRIPDLYSTSKIVSWIPESGLLYMGQK